MALLKSTTSCILYVRVEHKNNQRKAMFDTALTVGTLKAVTLVVVSAVFLWGTGLPHVVKTLEAAVITSASDTLSNSSPNQSSVHTLGFTTDNGLLIGETVVVSFPSGFDLTGLAISDISMTVGGTATNTASSAGAGTWGVATGTPTGQDIQFTTPTDQGVGSSTALVLTIGSESGTMITNPSATTSYGIDIGGTMQDSGQVRVAIIDDVTVTSNVNASITFTISGVNSDETVNGSPTTTTATSSTVALPFGTLDTNVSKVLAHDLAVATNATNGYTVTVEQTGELQSASGAVIDGFIDGSWAQTPTAWQAPSAQVTDLTSYGHWGLTSTDGTTTRSSEFSSDTWVSGSTTPVVLMGHTGPADGTTAGVGTARVGYQIEISALQEAGDDYTTTLRYVATPTF